MANYIQKRRAGMVGHLLRHNGPVRDILVAEIGVKSGRGRPRLNYYLQIVRDVGCTTFGEMYKPAQDRMVWRVASNQS